MDLRGGARTPRGGSLGNDRRTSPTFQPRALGQAASRNGGDQPILGVLGRPWGRDKPPDGDGAAAAAAAAGARGLHVVRICCALPLGWGTSFASPSVTMGSTEQPSWLAKAEQKRALQAAAIHAFLSEHPPVRVCHWPPPRLFPQSVPRSGHFLFFPPCFSYHTAASFRACPPPTTQRPVLPRFISGDF